MKKTWNESWLLIVYEYMYLERKSYFDHDWHESLVVRYCQSYTYLHNQLINQLIDYKLSGTTRYGVASSNWAKFPIASVYGACGRALLAPGDDFKLKPSDPISLKPRWYALMI